MNSFLKIIDIKEGTLHLPERLFIKSPKYQYMYNIKMKKIFVTILSLLVIFGSYKAIASTIPVNPSVFETYLANQMLSTDTSLTVASMTLRDGTALSGYACVTIDSNTATLEYTCGTVSGNTIINLVRGIDPISGTTTVSSLTFSHRRGADVKVTDYPIIALVGRILNGNDTLPNPIQYATNVSTSTLNSNGQNLASMNYVNGVAFAGAGVISATENAQGIVQLATATQTASGTILSSGGYPLVIQSKNATSTFNSAASAALKVVVTQGTGKIDTNFIATTTLFSNVTLTGTTTIPTNTNVGSYSIWQIGKNSFIASSSGATTFTVPTGVYALKFTIVGGGGGGGGGSNTGGIAGFGGGGGGACQGYATTTPGTVFSISVGAAGGQGGNGSGGAGNSGSVGATTTVTGVCIAGGGGFGFESHSAITTDGSGVGGIATASSSSFLLINGQSGGYIGGGESAFGLGYGGRGGYSTVTQPTAGTAGLVLIEY